MKKSVAIFLAIAMLFCFVGMASAATFSDTADMDSDVQSSIAKLDGLDVISGYPDGTFKPEGNITRAEFAKIAVVLAGMESSADIMKNVPSQFSDVATGVWYTGWVNVASSQSYVKGYPDGTYRPNETITNAQVVTVLLRVLGYDDNLPGPWPVDYIAKAGALGITDEVEDFDANAPASRAMVAVMADACLDATLVNWDNDTEDFEKEYVGDEELTLLDENFDGMMSEGYWVADWNWDDGVFSIDLDKWVDGEEDDQTISEGWYDLAEGVAMVGANVPNDVVYGLVDVIYNDDDEEIVYVELTSMVATAYGEDITYDDEEEEIEVNDDTYDLADHVAFADSAVLGTDEAGDFEDEGDFEYNQAYYVYMSADEEVYLIEEATDFIPDVVDEYATNTEKLDFKTSGSNDSYYDFTDEDVLVVKDGVWAELTDIEENDVVYVTEDAYGLYAYVEVFSAWSEGELVAAYDDFAELKLGSDRYYVLSDNALSNDNGDEFTEEIDGDGLDGAYSSDVEYFLTKDMQIAYVIHDEEASDSATMYGVIVSVNDVDLDDMVTEITVVTEAGTEVTYDIDTDEVEFTYSSNSKDQHPFQLILEDVLYGGDEYFIEYEVNEDNVIDDMTVLAEVEPGYDEDVDDWYSADEYIEISATDANADLDKLELGEAGWFFLTDDTVIFNSIYNDDDDDIEADIENVSDFLNYIEDEEGSYYDIYVIVDGNEVDYIYMNEELSAATADYAVVLDNYVYDGDPYVSVDVAGTAEDYATYSGSTITPEDAIYAYSITGGDFEDDYLVFNPYTGYVAGNFFEADHAYLEDIVDQVTDTDFARDAVEIDGDWYFADEDTVVYDYSDFYGDDDDPVFGSLSDINEDDYVIYVPSDDNDDADDNIAAMFIIVNDYSVSGGDIIGSVTCNSYPTDSDWHVRLFEPDDAPISELVSVTNCINTNSATEDGKFYIPSIAAGNYVLVYYYGCADLEDPDDYAFYENITVVDGEAYDASTDCD